jgi:hypothetical protein
MAELFSHPKACEFQFLDQALDILLLCLKAGNAGA